MEFHWWQTGVIYQIYPRSFMDSNGDGIGDLEGIYQRLDYLQWLGIDCIWISPIYPSPMKDFGYDVAHYTDIEPIFGDMVIFDRLLEAAHNRGIKLILDWVPNHTSDEHPWFIESRSSRDNPKRDWYIWKDAPENGDLPNNWLSFFGGPTWTWDEKTQQYYLHLFHPGQPDLNWRNPEVRAAMYDTLRFWLDKGVDGFRMDVISFLMKDARFRDNPMIASETQSASHYDNVYNIHRPDIHPVLQEIRSVIDEYTDRVSIGEIYLRPRSHWVRFYGQELDELHMPFNFDLLEQRWNATDMRMSVEILEASLPPGAWPNYVLGNHDQPRIASRFGDDAVRVAGMMLLTLRGAPTMYMGEELGMPNGFVPVDRIVDPPGLQLGPEHSRDGCRTPFQWSADDFAGFSTVEPWLPVGETFQERNMETEKDDPQSVLNLYHRLLEERHNTPALNRGMYVGVNHVPVNTFVYIREWEGERRLIALNFLDIEQSISVEHIAKEGEIILSTELDREGMVSLEDLVLRPNEGLLIKL